MLRLYCVLVLLKAVLPTVSLFGVNKVLSFVECHFHLLLQMEEPIDMGVLGTSSSADTQQENRPPPRQLRRTQR